MGKVVHVIDAACGPDAVLEAAQLAGPGEPIISIGPPPGWDDCPPCFGAKATITSVAASGLRARRGRSADLLAGRVVAQCWSVSAAAALRSAGAAAPQAIRLSAPATESDVAALRDLSGFARPAVACAHEGIAAALRRAQVPAEVRVIGPLACPAMTGQARRAEARERLRVGGDDIAVVAPAAAQRGSGHHMAVWATAILAVAEFPVRLLIRDTGRAARQVASFARDAGFGAQVVLAGADTALEEVLAAADLALFVGPGELPPAHLGSAMAAALPIISADTQAAKRWLTFGATALPTPAGRPRAIAQAVMRVVNDGALASRLGHAARRTVNERFHPDAIRGQWAELHAAVSGVH